MSPGLARSAPPPGEVVARRSAGRAVRTPPETAFAFRELTVVAEVDARAGATTPIAVATASPTNAMPLQPLIGRSVSGSKPERRVTSLVVACTRWSSHNLSGLSDGALREWIGEQCHTVSRACRPRAGWVRAPGDRFGGYAAGASEVLLEEIACSRLPMIPTAGRVLSARDIRWPARSGQPSDH
jgi:hypothetical protein